MFEIVIAGFEMRIPQLDIHTVAAGGGSRLFYNNGMFVVGPESAGAHPGPLCYRKVSNCLYSSYFGKNRNFVSFRCIFLKRLENDLGTSFLLSIQLTNRLTFLLLNPSFFNFLRMVIWL